jgi:hypothetical protein
MTETRSPETSLCLILPPEGMTAEEHGKTMFGTTFSASVIAGKDDHNIEVAEVLARRGFSDDEALELVFNALANPGRFRNEILVTEDS